MISVEGKQVRRGNDIPRLYFMFRFKKKGMLRFISQMEVQNLIVRIFRRLNFPIVYSEGFHPRPKLGFSPAVRTGIVDLALYALGVFRFPPEDPIRRFNFLAPRGLEMVEFGETDANFLKRIEGFRYKLLVDSSLVVNPKALDKDMFAVESHGSLLVIKYHKKVGEKDGLYELLEELTGTRYPSGFFLAFRTDGIVRGG